MKKVLLGLGLFAASFAMAQKVGVKAGGNLASISENDTKSKFGFYAGAYFNAPLTDKLSIQPEVLYSLQGAKSDVAGANATLNTGYVNVPVMLQYNLAEGFFVEAGPQFGFLTSAKMKATVAGYTGEVDVKDTMNSFDFGIGLGAGYFITPKLSVNARYTAGITDIAKDNSGDAVRNNVFQFGLGYTIN
ncbi:MAG: PorT family protein [Bacteroidetes bacterium]|nr:PorT family protein [Bacteroidota bacterium]